MSQGSDHKVTRRALLRKAGTAGAVIGLGALGGASPWTAVRALANHPKRIDITEFIWIGGGQGIVPREVKRAYEKLHPNVHVELFEGTNATTYPRMVAQREVNPNKPLVN